HFITRFGKFIRFSHTVFALPFALMAMLIASDGWPAWTVLGWILWCMVCARSLAMLFNRIADWEIDKLNPRTVGRHQLIQKSTALMVWAVAMVAFCIGAGMLNPLCLVLSPVAILLICFYSLTKRFTVWCHAFLGLALSAAPMGAWAAVTGQLLSPEPYLLALGVLLWVSGFDLIYSTLDMEFDQKQGLYSFPSRFGLRTTRQLSVLLHVAALLVFMVFGRVAELSWPYGICWLACIGMVVQEHRWAQQGDVDAVNKAFFQANAGVSVLLLLGVGLSYLT
ncbi:MAG: UbiA-like polyprenyltransferase, partial [Verrucomicrobiota bacterium]